MNEVLHANIFFFIASVATVFFCVLLSIALWHVIKILQSVRSVLERIEAGSEVLASDLAHIRMFFAEGGLFANIMNLFGGKRSTRRTKKITKDD